jgi:hypothetical protein
MPNTESNSSGTLIDTPLIARGCVRDSPASRSRVTMTA